MWVCGQPVILCSFRWFAAVHWWLEIRYLMLLCTGKVLTRVRYPPSSRSFGIKDLGRIPAKSLSLNDLLVKSSKINKLALKLNLKWFWGSFEGRLDSPTLLETAPIRLHRLVRWGLGQSISIKIVCDDKDESVEGFLPESEPLCDSLMANDASSPHLLQPLANQSVLVSVEFK